MDFVKDRSRERRHVVLVGAYGIENAGDDAPLLVVTETLRAAYPHVDFAFTVFSRHADPLMEEASGARFLPNLEYESREAARGKWFRGFNPGDDRAELAQLEAAIRDADLVVAGAGNVFIDLALDLFRGPIPLMATYCFLADLHRTPFVLFGVSAGPLATEKGRELSAWIARRSSAVTVRDAGSARLLRRLAPEVSVDVLPDPVLGLAPCDDAALERALRRERIPPRGDRPRLALALRDLAFLGFERGAVVAALKELALRYELLFLPQCTYQDCDDRIEARAIAAELSGAACFLVERRQRPDVLLRLYESADVTLASRLHGAVFSAMAGVPVVGLAYLPKVGEFLRGLGKGRRALQLDGLSPGDLVEAVEAARGEDGEAWRRACRERAGAMAAYEELLGRALDLERPRSALPTS